MSSNFASASSSDPGRQRFASTAVNLINDLGFDGIDIDWEYPQDPTEAGHFVELLSETRRHLGDKLLTVASSAGPEKYKILNLNEMNGYVDLWNLMAYDYAGTSNNGTTGHQSNLFPSRSKLVTPFNTDQAVQYYLAHGIPPQKLNLGIPLYGRAFVGTSGLGTPYSSKGNGSWEPGVWDYKVLPLPGSKTTLDVEAGASYSFDASEATVISYDNKASVLEKVDYIVSRNLGGTSFWEASGDRNDSESLVGVVRISILTNVKANMI